MCEDYLVSRILFGELTVVGVSKIPKPNLLLGGPKFPPPPTRP